MVKEVKMVKKVKVGVFQEPLVWPRFLWATHTKDGSEPIPCYVSGYLKINHYWSPNLHWRPLKNHSGCPWLLFRMGDKGFFPFTPDEILGSHTEAFISESKSHSCVWDLGKWGTVGIKAPQRLASGYRDINSVPERTLLLEWWRALAFFLPPPPPTPPEQDTQANRSLKSGERRQAMYGDKTQTLCVCFLYMYSIYYSTTVESN